MCRDRVRTEGIVDWLLEEELSAVVLLVVVRPLEKASSTPSPQCKSRSR